MAKNLNIGPYLKYISGFLPVNKPKGVCSRALLDYVAGDINFVLRSNGIKSCHYKVYMARNLDTFSNGLVTFVLGRGESRRRNFIYADYKYKLTIEFGVERKYSTIDGDVMSYKNANHLNSELIERSTLSFIGETNQLKPQSYRRYEPNHNAASLDNGLPVERLYQQMVAFDKWPKQKEEKKQRYPLAPQPKTVMCNDIILRDFNPPYATFEVHCKGSFDLREFCQSLAEDLGTKGSIVDMTRYQEGPITLDDLRVFQMHETHLDYYIQRIHGFQYQYNQYLSSLDCNFDTEHSTYL